LDLHPDLYEKYDENLMKFLEHVRDNMNKHNEAFIEMAHLSKKHLV
jgi:hypothetical protein